MFNELCAICVVMLEEHEIHRPKVLYQYRALAVYLGAVAELQPPDAAEGLPPCLCHARLLLNPPGVNSVCAQPPSYCAHIKTELECVRGEKREGGGKFGVDSAGGEEEIEEGCRRAEGGMVRGVIGATAAIGADGDSGDEVERDGVEQFRRKALYGSVS